MFDTIEKYYICEAAYIDNQLNDRSTVTPNVIFDTILLNMTQQQFGNKRRIPYRYPQLCIHHHTGHTALKHPDSCYCSLFLYCATLTEVFPCFFLCCKANARV
jgi:hypothetical protein